jgi:hypothetical protein
LNPTLSVDVYREPDYFAQGSRELKTLFFFVTYVVCSIMAAGALVGALNTMYAAGQQPRRGDRDATGIGLRRDGDRHPPGAEPARPCAGPESCDG